MGFGAVHISGGIQSFFGDGSDGELNTTGNVTLTSTLDGDAVIKQYTSVTINSGHTLTVSNPCQGLVLYCDTLTNYGTISMSKKASLVVQNPPLPLLKGAVDSWGYNMLNIVAEKHGGAGGNGGNTSSYGGVGGGGVNGRAWAGGFGGGGAGGTGGQYPPQGSHDISLSVSAGRASLGVKNTGLIGAGQDGRPAPPGMGGQPGTHYLGGVGGAGGACFGGGGGGAGGQYAGSGSSANDGGNGERAGGFVLIIAKQIINHGIIEANGGNGGAGGIYGYAHSGYGSGGGGAGGGVIWICFKTGYTNNGTIQCNGGNGGTGYAAGTAGGVGTICAEQIV